MKRRQKRRGCVLQVKYHEKGEGKAVESAVSGFVQTPCRCPGFDEAKELPEFWSDQTQRVEYLRLEPAQARGYDQVTLKAVIGAPGGKSANVSGGSMEDTDRDRQGGGIEFGGRFTSSWHLGT